TRHALEGLGASVLESKAGPRDKVLDGAGHQDLAGPGGRGDPRADVNREPGNLVTMQLDLARVEACAHVESERPDSLGHRAGASDGARRPVERREEAVAGRIDLAAPV